MSKPTQDEGRKMKQEPKAFLKTDAWRLASVIRLSSFV